MTISDDSLDGVLNSYNTGYEKKSRQVDVQTRLFEGPRSPILMCQKSPKLLFQEGPVLSSQRPAFREEAFLDLDSCKDDISADRPSTLESPASEDDKSVAVSEVVPSSRKPRKRCSQASLKFECPPNVASKVSSVKDAKDIIFIEDVKIDNVEAGDSEQLKVLLCDIRNLWKEVKFGSDFFEFMAKHTAVKLTILARVNPALDNSQECNSENLSLVGFLLYQLHPKKKCLSVRRLAVSPALQRRGHARQLMKWCVRVPGVNYLALTSLPAAVPFYRSFGFRKVETWHSGGAGRPDDEPCNDNQVYMEYCPGTQGAQRRKARK